MAGLAVACLIAFVHLRAVSTVARWMALGPGRIATRAIVGTFLLSLIYALTLALRGPSASNAATVEELAWAAFPIGFQLTGWLAAAALGERDVLGDRPVERTSVSLRDALLALALFGVAAAALRLAIGGEVRWTIEGEPAESLFWSKLFALILLIVVWVDAAVRLSFAGERGQNRSRREALQVCVAGGISLGFVALEPTAAAFVLPIVALLAACYAGLSIVQEKLMRKFGLRAINVRTTSVQPPTDEAGEGAQA